MDSLPSQLKATVSPRASFTVPMAAQAATATTAKDLNQLLTIFIRDFLWEFIPI